MAGVPQVGIVTGVQRKNVRFAAIVEELRTFEVEENITYEANAEPTEVLSELTEDTLLTSLCQSEPPGLEGSCFCSMMDNVVMLKNIPKSLTRNSFILWLERAGWKTFDYVHLVFHQNILPGKDRPYNKGYAYLNFGLNWEMVDFCNWANVRAFDRNQPHSYGMFPERNFIAEAQFLSRNDCFFYAVNSSFVTTTAPLARVIEARGEDISVWSEWHPVAKRLVNFNGAEVTDEN